MVDKMEKSEAGAPFQARGLVTAAIQIAGVAVLAVLVIQSVTWWGELPERDATVRFAYQRAFEETAPAGTDFAAWFALPGLGTAMTLLFHFAYFSKNFLARHPSLASLPRHRAFLALPPEARKRVIAFALARLSLFPIPLNAFMVFGQWAQFEAAHGRLAALEPVIVAAFVFAALFSVVWYLASIAAVIGHEERAQG